LLPISSVSFPLVRLVSLSHCSLIVVFKILISNIHNINNKLYNNNCYYKNGFRLLCSIESRRSSESLSSFSDWSHVEASGIFEA
ncbi:hypothetical protein T03_13484, partial [Trichinella britovi]